MSAKGFLFALFLSLLAICDIYAQSCAEVLNSARERFSAGQLYSIPALLKPCLESGFNKDQRLEAYWLLTRTYLFIDDPISAEDSYLKLLKQDPEYKLNPETDPIDIVYLSKKFKTTPIFVLHAKGGLNISSVSTIHNYGVDNTSQTNENYSSNVGMNFGLGGELNLSDHFSFGLEVNFYSRKYSYTNTLFNADKQTFSENQIGLDLPVLLKYRWDFEKIRPYLYCGIGVDYLLQAKATVKLIDRVNAGTEDLTEIPVTGPQIDVGDQRNKLTYFAHFGAGVNYRWKYNYLVFDVRYKLGLSNMVSEDGQYGNPVLLYRYGFVDDDKKLDNYAITIGFVRPLYKPRKITPSSKGLMSKLFGKKD